MAKEFYHVVEAENLKDLLNEVAIQITQGYKPLGGITIVPEGHPTLTPNALLQVVFIDPKEKVKQSVV